MITMVATIFITMILLLLKTRATMFMTIVAISTTI